MDGRNSLKEKKGDVCMKLQKVIDCAYNEWLDRDVTGQPEEVQEVLGAFDVTVNQALIGRDDIVRKVLDRNCSCTAAYEKYGFREGFKIAIGILQALTNGQLDGREEETVFMETAEEKQENKNPKGAATPKGQINTTQYTRSIRATLII